ncbi:P-loop containing nucleoside triphosphate hydrolase protein [Mycena rosella]|uniref:P-loop containing nucleoside triphosphate hydrolase protein n=1 Tax=Mycena rosella TaxID=1033263 RepID=A0AAD7M9Y9_MYCRO|nr:P-loop containing nucleoside triphosphate hydrolase protein [Mycena rosella]
MADLPNIQEDTAVPSPDRSRSPVAYHRFSQSSRRRSSASHVDVDFFDPDGVQTLQRTMTQISERHPKSQFNGMDSEVTLNPGDGPFDFQKTLQFVMKKVDEAEIQRRELGVVFQDLGVVGLGASASFQPTLGSTLNPLSIIENIQTMRHPPLRNILEGFSGVVRPGEMLLVLGRPGSGCSTLLKTLANQTDEYHHVSGSVHYDSLTPEAIRAHYRGDVQYCPEDDVHFPTLTVEQTLRFAARLRAPHQRVMDQDRDKYVESIVEIMCTVFGLRHVRGTQVGNAAIRGVSGGQKKRVSIAEALVTRMRIGAWDNSTRGLDASTALEFGRALRIATDVSRVSTLVSIYQASETLYSLFDKVCVLSEGRMVYFGPADQARDYFLSLGYVPQAERQTTPDFLVSVTDPAGRVVRPGLTPAEDQARPRTSAELAEHFLASPMMADNLDDINAYNEECAPGLKERVQQYKRSAQAEHANGTRRASPYMTSLPMQARAVMMRRVQIIMGSKTATVINLATFIIQGIIVGSVFVNSPEATSAYFSRGGVMFFALLFAALASLAEIPALYAQRPIVLRQSKAALYHPFMEAVALTLVDLPITFSLTIVFSILLYFIVGLQRTAAQFFTFFLFLITLSVTMKAFFRAIAAAFKSPAAAQSFAGLILLVLVIYTGYTIPKSSMIGALRWITYINPLRYGFEGIVANEFHTLKGTCSQLVPRGPGYENITLANQVCATVGAVQGQAFVDGNRFIAVSFGYSYANEWMNFGIVVAFLVGFIMLLFVFTEVNTSSTTDTSVVLFKRGSKKAVVLAGPADAEKAGAATDLSGGEDHAAAEEALAAAAPMTDVFSWQNLNYVVPVKEGKRKLLDNISGYVLPGKLTALMGESGAGKTTLLNTLAERTTTGVVTGDIFVNGHAPPSDFRSQTGYVQQMDTHVPTDTVREALMFSATLRQPSSVPLAEKAAYVETCLKMCGLEAVADASVGSLGVEHRKRTTIAVELAAKPKLLLFLDEPTSGLDSQSAWAILLFLRQLAAAGQAILCTIHQPSAELFQIFDRLLLLRKGGQVVYFGDIGKNSTTLIRYFEANGSRSCEPAENPAEFMLDVIGAGATASSAQDWGAIWRQSSESAAEQAALERIHAEGRSRGAVETAIHSNYAATWMQQATSLFRRDIRFRWRDPTYLLAKAVLNIVAGLFIGFTFYQAKASQQGTQNQLFAIYMSLILAAPLGNQIQVPFLEMRNTYEIREGPTKFLSWSAVVTSSFLSELPFNIIGSSIYFLCWYWTVGFDTSRAGYTYLMLGVIFPMYYTSFAQAVAAMAPNPEIAAVLFSFFFSFSMNFNGVLQPFRALGWWRWMYRVSPYTYLTEGLLGQALGKHPITCSPVELVKVDPTFGQTCGEFFAPYISSAGGYVANPNASSACEFCSTSTTDQLLGANFNIFYSHHWRDAGLMFVYIGANIIGLYLLTYFFRIRTTSIFSIFKRRKAAE